MKLRLFVGITAPPEWKAAITEWRLKIQPRFSDSFGRWTAESNLHLTLRFFGAVEENELAALGRGLQEIAASREAFTMAAGILGCFPDASRPRIVWLGFDRPANTVSQIELDLRTKTAHFGQPPEDRDFHPHLTIVRTNEPRRSDRDFLAHLISKGPPIEVPLWQVRELELIRSELKPGGSVYTTLMALPLAPTS